MFINCRPLVYFFLLFLATPSTVLSEEIFTIGGLIDKPRPPFSWVDYCLQENQGTINVMVEEILDELNVNYRILAAESITPTLMQSLTDRVNNNQLSALIAVDKSFEEQQVMLSNEPIVIVKTAIVYLKKKPIQLIDYSQLKTLKGAVPPARMRPRLSSLFP